MCHNVAANTLALTLRYVDEHRALGIKTVDVNVYYIVAVGNEGANNQAVDQLAAHGSDRASSRPDELKSTFAFFSFSPPARKLYY